LFLNQHRLHFTSFLTQAQRDEIMLNDEDASPSGVDYTFKQWLNTMIYMSQQIEIKEELQDYKLLQCIPLYSNLVPGNITFDSRCLAISCDLYSYTDKADKFNPKNIHSVWDVVFKTKSKPWKFSKNYVFTGMCQTDGVSISLQYIHRDQYDAYVSKKSKRSQMGVLVKSMTDEELLEYQEAKQKRQHDLKIQQAQKRKEFREENKGKKKTSRQGISYVDTIDKKILLNKKVYIDPGNNTLMAMIDDQYQTTQSNIEKKQHQYMYTRRERRHDCGMNTRLKTSQVRLGRNPTIVEYQTQMSTTRRKTSMMNTYTHYLDVFFSCITQEILDFFGNTTWWRYQKLRSYGLVQKHENALLNQIQSKFGDETVYIIGDHSVRCMKGTSPSKGIGLKRLLQSRFEHVYHIDEYNTSKLYWRTHLEGEQWYSKEARSYLSKEPKKKGRRGRGVEPKRYKNPKPPDIVINIQTEPELKGREIHALKKFQSLNSLSMCINRDLNAVLNMRYIVQYLMEHDERPIEYCRRRTLNLAGPT
jgi:hypothetical protein